MFFLEIVLLSFSTLAFGQFSVGKNNLISKKLVIKNEELGVSDPDGLGGP